MVGNISKKRVDNAVAESIKESISEAKKITENVEAAAEKYPYVGENGNWFVWNSELGEFVDTGMPSQGDKGDPGHSPEKGVDYYTDAEKEQFTADIITAGNEALVPLVESAKSYRQEAYDAADELKYEVKRAAERANQAKGYADDAARAELNAVNAKQDAVTAKNEAVTAQKAAETARDAAETFSKKGPYIGDNGNWFVWNITASAYRDTGIKAEGSKGDKGDKGNPGKDGYTPVKGVDYYTDAEKEAFVSEIKEESAEEVVVLSAKVQSIPHSLKYDMGFAVGGLGSSGALTTSTNGIVTSGVEPLEYDFNVTIKWDNTKYLLYYGIYNEDGTFKRYSDNSVNQVVISAGTKFRLWVKFQDTSVVLNNINNDIFYSLEIISCKDAVEKSTLMGLGCLPVDSLDCVKEIYLEGAEDKNIIIGFLSKNNSVTNGYQTRFYLAFADAPYTAIAQYTIIADAPIEEFDAKTPIVLTAQNESGVSGYAIIDFNALEDGTAFNPQCSVNMIKACNLPLNPMIKEFLDDGKVEKEINKRISSIPHELKYDMSFTIGGLSSSGDVTAYTTGIVTNTEEPLVYDFDILAKFNPEICRFYYRIYKDDGSSTIIENTTGYVRISAGTKFRIVLKHIVTTETIESLDDEIFKTFEIMKDTADIVSLNKDVEHLVIQASKSRSSKFGDTLVPLEFVHFTDLHAHNQGWKRIVEYIDEYEKYIKFGLHTGDYCGTSVDDGVDLYSLVKPKNRIIYNMVGNHDTYKAYTSGESPETATADEIYNAVFSDVEGWDVVFGNGENVTYYYKDFTESGIRLIVLDDQQWSDAQGEWLASALDEAKTNGLAVITASHMLTANLTERLASTFAPVDKTPNVYGGSNLFESTLVSFKNNGGIHICHLCGHNHFDDIGYTEGGVLNIQAECAAVHSDARLESVRAEGTKSFDCFNVVSVDVNTKRLKIIRIGCNSNAALQDKTLLCYDYENKKIISGIDTSKVVDSMVDILDELNAYAENLILGGAE